MHRTTTVIHFSAFLLYTSKTRCFACVNVEILQVLFACLFTLGGNHTSTDNFNNTN